MRKFIRMLLCSFTGTRCLFCNTEVCAVWPKGNPYIDSDYRKNMESVIKKMNNNKNM